MHVACGKCLQCRTGEAHICQNVKIIGVDANGAFAEYVVIPESNIWKLDPAIPLEYASILDPLGNAVHTVLAGEIAAKSVAITGCGPIGLFSIDVAKAVGAASVFAIEVNEHRARIAREMQADYVLNPAKEDVDAIIMEKTGGLGVDVVLDFFFQAEDGIRDHCVTGVQTCALPIYLPLGDAAVDRVLLVHALEMSRDAEALLREAWRVLAPGGRLLAVIPNRRGIWARKIGRASCRERV